MENKHRNNTKHVDISNVRVTRLRGKMNPLSEENDFCIKRKKKVVEDNKDKSEILLKKKVTSTKKRFNGKNIKNTENILQNKEKTDNKNSKPLMPEHVGTNYNTSILSCNNHPPHSSISTSTPIVTSTKTNLPVHNRLSLRNKRSLITKNPSNTKEVNDHIELDSTVFSTNISPVVSTETSRRKVQTLDDTLGELAGGVPHEHDGGSSSKEKSKVNKVKENNIFEADKTIEKSKEKRCYEVFKNLDWSRNTSHKSKENEDPENGGNKGGRMRKESRRSVNDLMKMHLLVTSDEKKKFKGREDRLLKGKGSENSNECRVEKLRDGLEEVNEGECDEKCEKTDDTIFEESIKLKLGKDWCRKNMRIDYLTSNEDEEEGSRERGDWRSRDLASGDGRKPFRRDSIKLFETETPEMIKEKKTKRNAMKEGKMRKSNLEGKKKVSKNAEKCRVDKRKKVVKKKDEEEDDVFEVTKCVDTKKQIPKNSRKQKKKKEDEVVMPSKTKQLMQQLDDINDNYELLVEWS